jgi:hypothetical protein
MSAGILAAFRAAGFEPAATQAKMPVFINADRMSALIRRVHNGNCAADRSSGKRENYILSRSFLQHTYPDQPGYAENTYSRKHPDEGVHRCATIVRRRQHERHPRSADPIFRNRKAVRNSGDRIFFSVRSKRHSCAKQTTHRESGCSRSWNFRNAEKVAATYKRRRIQRTLFCED